MGSDDPDASGSERDDLSGLKVLIAEDEAIVAMGLVDIVEDESGRVVGPFASVSDCLSSIANALPDLAILDLRLVDGETLSVASLLADHGVPIVFHSGHMSDGDWDSPHAAVLYCGKPCSDTEMKRALLSAARMS